MDASVCKCDVCVRLAKEARQRQMLHILKTWPRKWKGKRHEPTHTK